MRVEVSITADGHGDYELDLTPEELRGIEKLAAACEAKLDKHVGGYTMPRVEITPLG